MDSIFDDRSALTKVSENEENSMIICDGMFSVENMASFQQHLHLQRVSTIRTRGMVDAARACIQGRVR